ncbi:MAG: 30S ribosomal protein S4, partial [Candidatus Paceibacterota bacterium]
MINKPKYKVARRLGPHVFEKTQTQKFALRGASVGPARVWKRGKSRTEFGNKILEKQRARTIYGVNEKQFTTYVKDIAGERGINRAEALMAKLESRLDNVVFRMGLANTRQASRQLVSHGHIAVNGRRVNIPSYNVKKDDRITIPERSHKSKLFVNLEEKYKTYTCPSWMTFDAAKKT